MDLFFQTGIIGYIYFFSTLLLFCYLVYLSVIDVKYHILEYWQTGGLFLISLLNLAMYIISENVFLASVGAQTVPWWKYLIIHLSSALLTFILLIVIILVKRGTAGIGGADIWALTTVSLNVGIMYLPYLLIAICAAYLVFALGYKIIKKSKLQRAAFLPFISFGTIVTLIMLSI